MVVARLEAVVFKGAPVAMSPVMELPAVGSDTCSIPSLNVWMLGEPPLGRWLEMRALGAGLEQTVCEVGLLG